MSKLSSLVLAGMFATAVAACAGGNNSSPGASTGGGAGASTGTGGGSSIAATIRPPQSTAASTSTGGASAGASLSASTGASAGPSAAPSTEASLSTSPGASLTGPAITVTAMDYMFTGMPTSVPVGTTLSLQNSGTEVHEMVVAMKNPGTTQTWDELLQMPEGEAFQYITVVAVPSQRRARPATCPYRSRWKAST